MKKIPRSSSEQLSPIDILDQVNGHRQKLKLIATLMEHVGSDHGEIEPQTISHTGSLILSELESMKGWLKQLELLSQRK